VFQIYEEKLVRFKTGRQRKLVDYRQNIKCRAPAPSSSRVRTNSPSVHLYVPPIFSV
jgi:hypothetical protein